jgi:hypothetical protein
MRSTLLSTPFPIMSNNCGIVFFLYEDTWRIKNSQATWNILPESSDDKNTSSFRTKWRDEL